MRDAIAIDDDVDVTVRQTSLPTPDTIEVSVVMPCLDEERTVGTCIKKATDCLTSLGVAHEIIIADNGSTDTSREIATQHGARVVPVEEKGYGNAIMGGIRAARGTYVIMGDADDSYDFANLGPFIEQLRAGHELVMGNRFRGGIQPSAMPPLHRLVGNPVLTFVGRLFFKSPCKDFHCGLRGFARDAVMRMNIRSTGMEFASEMVIKAALLGMRTTEVPTTLSPDGRGGRPPHLRTFRDGWRHLRFMLLYSHRWLFFYPGVAAALLGLSVVIALLGAPRTIGGVTFDVHTMLIGAALLMVGFQSIAFAVFTETFARAEGFLPRSERAQRLKRLFTLERGVILGAIVLLAGIAFIAAKAYQWQSLGFGNLDYRDTMRWIIPGVTLVAIGSQAVLASFFLGLLRLRYEGT